MKKTFTRKEYIDIYSTLEEAIEYIDELMGSDANESETIKYLKEKRNKGLKLIS
jgi:hypothetical protein